MLALFRETKISYCLVASIGGIILALVGVYINAWAILLALIWIFFWSIFFSVIAQKKYNNIVNLMNEECRVAETIDQMNKVLTYCKNKKLRNFLLINLSAAYLNIGNAEFTRQVFECLLPFPETANGVLQKATYLNNLVMYHLLMKDFASASLALDEFKAILSDPHLKQPQRDFLSPLCIDKVFALRMEKGDFEGAEQHYELTSEMDSCRLARISSKVRLGKAYLRNGKKEEARKVFLYAAENGGDSYYAEVAKQQLSSLESEAC